MANKSQTKELQKNSMMAHLLDALEAGQDIGHYGRLVFAMVARHFMSEQELIRYLMKDPECSEGDAKSLVRQVEGKDYNPPKRERILEWQQHQEFPICPDSEDPDSCNVYKDLTFPDEVYEHINSYYEQKSTVS
ncbi:hypothetical protein H6G89_09195 [Oscillatoria sp. FACHB-1407]|uniref:hypothetical protein n=1 Tax=Oscillatoria sp. FACHB-1407 TaxID=2692847 RepID=UPI001681FF4D|nr:hypothetical protein [Oscillatoria sp. FACHB-1407]MBD2461219.1 hypothetical protein [Oscillatoria sp. FACHB-1407]